MTKGKILWIGLCGGYEPERKNHNFITFHAFIITGSILNTLCVSPTSATARLYTNDTGCNNAFPLQRSTKNVQYKGGQLRTLLYLVFLLNNIRSNDPAHIRRQPINIHRKLKVHTIQIYQRRSIEQIRNTSYGRHHNRLLFLGFPSCFLALLIHNIQGRSQD